MSQARIPSETAAISHSSGRGRGRSRFHAKSSPSAKRPHPNVTNAAPILSEPASGSITPTEPQRQVKPPPARPTHFLMLPLKHCIGLRDRVSAFQSALLDHQIQIHDANSGTETSVKSVRKIEGLDATIMINPVRMHLTLGVMAVSEDGNTTHDALREPKEIQAQESKPVARTVSSALNLLQSLQPKLLELTGSSGVNIRLERMGAFPSGKKGKANAGVLWVGPDEDRYSNASSSVPDQDQDTLDWERLWKVCDFIVQQFRQAGYITEKRPLQLHCTIINTTFRRPRPRGGQRSGFSYDDIVGCDEAMKIIGGSKGHEENRASVDDKAHTSEGENPIPLTMEKEHGEKRADGALHRKQAKRSGLQSVQVQLGNWNIDEVQLCIMGSKGPEGEYVSCGKVKL